jgi:hypothetical protein
MKNLLYMDRKDRLPMPLFSQVLNCTCSISSQRRETDDTLSFKEGRSMQLEPQCHFGWYLFFPGEMCFPKLPVVAMQTSTNTKDIAGASSLAGFLI